VGVALVQAFLLFLLSHYRTAATEADPVPSPRAAKQASPPAPNLQSTPLQDYAEFAESQQRQLHTYGWVDKEQGVARVPVSRAMDLILERGLPEPAGAAAPVEKADASEPTPKTRGEREP
jgi:hypothetical protein